MKKAKCAAGRPGSFVLSLPTDAGSLKSSIHPHTRSRHTFLKVRVSNQGHSYFFGPSRHLSQSLSYNVGMTPKGMGMDMDKNTSLPSIGDPFPSIEVQTTQGHVSLPEDYKGSWFVLFSHPGDFTPVCTTEFVEFQYLYPEFEKLDTRLIGLSVDQVFSHLKWIEWIRQVLKVDITFPVIADPLGRTAKKLGMINPDKQTQTVRGVFIVDDKGIIRATIFYPAEVGRNSHEILRAVFALQTSDQKKVALPANWPTNRLIGEKGIVPPASTVDKINERIQQAQNGDITCYDWWLCFKDI